MRPWGFLWGQQHAVASQKGVLVLLTASSESCRALRHALVLSRGLQRALGSL